MACQLYTRALRLAICAHLWVDHRDRTPCPAHLSFPMPRPPACPPPTATPPPTLPPPRQVRAETLKFKEEGVFNVIKDVFLPWYNAYR